LSQCALSRKAPEACRADQAIVAPLPGWPLANFLPKTMVPRHQHVSPSFSAQTEMPTGGGAEGGGGDGVGVDGGCASGTHVPDCQLHMPVLWHLDWALLPVPAA
jgi:hypothetical protein